MTSNNCDWDKAWFYLRNDDELLPAYTGKLLTDKPASWGYGVSPPRVPGQAHGVHRRAASSGWQGANDGRRRRKLPPAEGASLMETRLPIYKLTLEAPSEGLRMMAELLSHEIAA